MKYSMEKAQLTLGFLCAMGGQARCLRAICQISNAGFMWYTFF